MTDKKNDDADPWFVAFVYLVFMAPAVMYGAWVTSVVWGWFLVPLGLPVVGLWHAAGLNMIIGWLTLYPLRDWSAAKQTSTGKLALWLTHAFFSPTAILAFGWIYHALMYEVNDAQVLQGCAGGHGCVVVGHVRCLAGR